MEAVILMGLQASGKSSFCKKWLFDTHIRINLDMLRTRHRERLLIGACIEAKQPWVVDNTNPTREDRLGYIQQARNAGFRVRGYYFASQIEQCKARNRGRSLERIVPLAGLLGTYGKLQLPNWSEGFDELYYVSIDEQGQFIVSEWVDEV